jgi:hypothetical protein
MLAAAPKPDDYTLDLYWHALNYRTAHFTQAEAAWLELEACVERLKRKAVADAQHGGAA